jgi:hypothetical protein
VSDSKTPAQTPVSRPTDELDRRLLATLAAHEGPAGICPRVPRLAALLEVSESTLHRALRRLIHAGQLERIPVFERDDDPEWQRRGHRGSRPRRQTTNSYRLTPAPGVTASRETSAQTPVSPESVTPLEGKEPADGGYQGSRDGEYEPAPRESIEVAAVLEVGRQHEPSWAELRLDGDGILDRLRGQLDDVEVLSVVANDRPPTDYRTARGRVIDLTGGKRPEGKQAVRDLHQALDELVDHTCRRVNGNGTERCTPDQNCGRHTARRRAR